MQIRTGPSVDRAIRHARELLANSAAEDAEAIITGLGQDSADVLHAVCRVLEANECNVEQITSVYDIVANLHWPDDEFDERRELLATLAYLAWNDCRRRGDFNLMSEWQGRCAKSVLAQEIVLDFFSLPVSQRSRDLTDRFLGNPAVVLALASKLASDRNRKPQLVAREAAFAFEWLAGPVQGISRCDEFSHLASEIALSGAVATRHLGRYQESLGWLARAEANAVASNGALIRVGIAFNRLALASDQHRFRMVLEQIPALIAEVTKLGFAEELGRCRFLEASVLKDAGKSEEALRRFQELRSATWVQSDPLMRGMTLMHIGELMASAGNHQEAMEHLQAALPFLQSAETPFALANLQAVLGEVLRDQCKLSNAIEAYRSALRIYGELQMDVRVAYLRVILAETLIAGGRVEEATLEILAALPVIKRERLEVDERAAITLLQESLRRLREDPNALRRLGDHIAQMQEKGQS